VRLDRLATGRKSRRKPVFSFKGQAMDKQLPLRTKVYIDGYNLYYGCLKGSPFKWLDIYRLFKDEILPSITVVNSQSKPLSIVLCNESSVNFFTAKILGNAASSPDSVSSQARYHQALKNFYPNEVSIVEGYYSINKVSARKVSDVDSSIKPKDCSDVIIWKMEEKQSDVNLALHAYHDAIVGNIDHAVFVTNDTDISPALKMIKENTSVLVGVVVPVRNPEERRANAELTKYADWKRTHINQDEIERSQLPRVISGRRKATEKPDSWYANPDKLNEIIELAKPVCGGRSKVFKWLEKANPHMQGQYPIKLLQTNEGAELVLAYVKNWISDLKNN
jgi:6-hydroxy-3-succinoylpyridine 3-monooxygenase